jgi:moderate conductance mechanosensitive channel
MLSLLAAGRGAKPFVWGRSDTILVVSIVVVAVVVTVVARLLVGRFQRKLEGKVSLTQDLNLQRAATLTHALSTGAIVLIWTIAMLLILSNVGVNLAPLLASAGVAGVALGFGAQSIVRDTLSGFFILLENQFGVGDIVEVQTAAGAAGGKVESLTLRITTLRAFDGTLHVIPNGNIQLVSNKSRGWARAIVDVRLAYGEDVQGVRDMLEELFEELRAEPAMRDWLMEGPSVLGIETLADYGQVIRVVAETRPSKRPDVERVLRERISARLAERGVQVPTPSAMMRSPDGG